MLTSSVARNDLLSFVAELPAATDQARVLDILAACLPERISLAEFLEDARIERQLTGSARLGGHDLDLGALAELVRAAIRGLPHAANADFARIVGIAVLVQMYELDAYAIAVASFLCLLIRKECPPEPFCKGEAVAHPLERLFSLLTTFFFSTSEFRRWASLDVRVDVGPHLPGDAAGLADLVWAAINLWKCRGVLDIQMFRRLAGDFPGRRTEIEEVSAIVIPFVKGLALR